MGILGNRRMRLGVTSALMVVVCVSVPGCANLQTSLTNVASLINQIAECAEISDRVTVEQIEIPVREFLAASGFAVDDSLIAIGIDTVLIPILQDLLTTCQNEGIEGLLASNGDLLNTPGFDGLLPGFTDLPGGPNGPGGPGGQEEPGGPPPGP